jgi:hypothetical protein
MFCSKCGNKDNAVERFCRKCGADLERAIAPSGGQQAVKKPAVEAVSGDPDELIGSGLASLFMGDGFFFVGLLLSVMDSSVKSFLWLLLLIPAFFFFGKGVADVFKARQIRRRLKQDELNVVSTKAELPPPRPTVVDVLKNYNSGELASSPSVTERTTRQLQ